MIDRKNRVLVVDDQPVNLLVLEDLLSESYEVLTFDDGRGILDYFKGGGQADIILLDVVMPGVDGFEVCRQLKSDGDTRDIPIIFLTSLDSETDEAFALSLGAEDFIHKPFSSPIVLARIEIHLRLSRTTRQLRDRNQDLERLTTSTAGVGLWDLNPASQRLVWSAEMQRLHGLGTGGFEGVWEDWLTRIHPDDAARFEGECQAAFQGRTVFSSEFRILWPDGEERFVKVTGVIRRDQAGRAVRVLGNCQDVTAYRQALIQLEEARRQAEAASAAKGLFLANMSHELRTPLNAISGFAHLLAVTESRPDRREQLEIIKKSCQVLLNLIQNILEYSKIESGKISVVSRDFVIRDELRTMFDLFDSEARAKGLSLHISIPSFVPHRLRGDVNVFRQILMNLIANAIKFTNKGSVNVGVSLSPAIENSSGHTILVQVSDTGIGIKPENQQRIFDAFEQEDNSLTRSFGGVGLGLSVCRQLVGLLDGRIWVESVKGVGSRFSFTAVFGPPTPETESGHLGQDMPVLPPTENITPHR